MGSSSSLTAQQRPSSRKFGFVDIAALGGEGSCGNCGYIRFQTQAFDQLVLAEDKKELIRAVARNSGGSGGGLEEDSEHASESDDDDDEDDDFEDVGIDVVANKGGASIFLLHGPPGMYVYNDSFGSFVVRRKPELCPTVSSLRNLTTAIFL